MEEKVATNWKEVLRQLLLGGLALFILISGWEIIMWANMSWISYPVNQMVTVEMGVIFGVIYFLAGRNRTMLRLLEASGYALAIASIFGLVLLIFYPQWVRLLVGIVFCVLLVTLIALQKRIKNTDPEVVTS